jgi:hypothetical protein
MIGEFNHNKTASSNPVQKTAKGGCNFVSPIAGDGPIITARKKKGKLPDAEKIIGRFPIESKVPYCIQANFSSVVVAS